jgi:hypothetical protein
MRVAFAVGEGEESRRAGVEGFQGVGGGGRSENRVMRMCSYWHASGRVLCLSPTRSCERDHEADLYWRIVDELLSGEVTLGRVPPSPFPFQSSLATGSKALLLHRSLH